jgi:hypothetical protein
MKSSLARALVLIVLQVGIVGSLAAKYEYDRAHCPRVWTRAFSYDPSSPIRGRYATLQLEIDAPGVFNPGPLVESRNPTAQRMALAPCNDGMTSSKVINYEPVWQYRPVRLQVDNGHLAGVPDHNSNISAQYSRDSCGKSRTVIADAVNFYVPEHAENLPTWTNRTTPKTEWWVEVTLPKKGPPRPLRLGTKRANGEITPLPTN